MACLMAFLGACLGAAGAAQAQEQHPDLVSGELANGLAYALLPVEGAEAVSFRLVVRVGSQAEDDTDRGVAHFVEHMAFRSTRRFPDGGPDRAMGAAGAVFGRDHNAFTGRWATTYHLDLPTAEAATVDLALAWLRDVGDGLRFLEAEVAAERGVVLAERRDGLRSGDAADELETAFHFRPENNLTPVGAAATLNALSAADLRAFHAKWYRPDRSLIVAAGALDPGQMLARLEAVFGDWAGAGARPAMAAMPSPEPPEAVSALVIPPSRLPAQSRACRNTPYDPAAEDDPLYELRRRVLTDIVDRRLGRAAARSPGIYALAFDGPAFYETRQVTCLVATHRAGQGPAALTLGQSVLRTLAAEGPRQDEVDAAIARQRAEARGDLTSLASVSPAQLADALAYGMVFGRPFLHPRQTMRQISRLAGQVRPEGLRLALARIWPAEAPATLSVEEVGTEAETLIAAWNAGEAAPLAEPLPAPAPLSFEFGSPGRVVRREALGEGAVRLTFANGLVLKHLRTRHAPGQAHLRIRMGPTPGALSPDDLAAAVISAKILPYAGADGQPYADLNERLGAWDWAFEAGLEEQGLEVAADSFASQIGPHLAVITLHLTRPNHTAETLDALALVADELERSRRLDPTVAVDMALHTRLWPDLFEVPGDPETYRRLTAERLRAALAPFLASGPAELVLVGDLDEAEAVRLTAETLGARPRRPRAAGAPFPPQTYARAPPAPVEVTHEGPGDRAAAALRWPLVFPHPPAEQAAAFALALLLEEAVVAETRHRQGWTYSPQVGLAGVARPGEAVALAVVLTPQAQDLDAAVASVTAEARRLAASAPEAGDLERLRRMLLQALAEQDRSNAALASDLLSLDDWATRQADRAALQAALGDLTPADVQAAARAWLQGPPILALARPALSPEPRP